MDAERLEPIDCAFLSLDGPVTTGHMCLVAILDGPTTLTHLRRQVEAGLDQVPILRRRLHDVALGLDRPWWVDDLHFDIANHLFEADLPEPGDDLILAEAAAHIDQRHLDRSRPLWEVHLLHRLAPGPGGERSALVIKVHHAAVDGVAARDLLAQLFPAEYGPTTGTGTSRGTSLERWVPRPTPSAAELVLHSTVDVEGAFGTAVRWENRAAREVAGLTQRVSALTIGAVERILGLPVAPLIHRMLPQLPVAPADAVRASPVRRWFNAAPACVLNRAITSERSWAFGSVPLARITAVRAVTDSTVNDVVLAATAGGLRAWLIERGSLPRQPLVAMVPISMRPVGEEPSSGNQIALTLCDLPTHLGDPLTRLTVTRDDMAIAKAAPSLGQTLMQDVARVTAPTVTRLVTGGFYALGLAERVRLPFNLIVSNVPAGDRSAAPGGHAVLGTYPFPALSDAMALNLTVQGRNGSLDLGLSACPELVPDVWHVLELIRAAYDELGALADQAAQRAMG